MGWKMKEKIVAMLRQSAEPLSGEEISRRLEVSRVAVWKQIGQLKESGIEIEAGTKGYRLLSSPEVPLPWLFGERSSRIHYFPEVDSTMNRATELARAGCPPFTVVVADRQSAGRGGCSGNGNPPTAGSTFPWCSARACCPGRVR